MLFNFPCFIINETTRTIILIISTTFFHVLNMQGTKYGMQTSERILREFMKHGFKRMCIVYERLGANVCFFYLRNHVYIYYNLFL